MPTAKEFTLTMDDRPGTLGKVCRALADRDVNIVAVQSFPYASSGKALTRFVFDDPTKARSVLDAERATYTETEVVKVDLPNRLGELAGAAQKLGDAGININYLYCGAEPNSNAPAIIFGVAEVGNAAPLVEQTAPLLVVGVKANKRTRSGDRQQSRSLFFWVAENRAYPSLDLITQAYGFGSLAVCGAAAFIQLLQLLGSFCIVLF